MAGHLIRHTEHHLQHAFGQAGIVQRPGQGQRGGGAFLARLEHHTATGSQRCRELARRGDGREIPRCERCDGADGLAFDQLQYTRTIGRDNTAVDASCAFGEPLEIFRRTGHFIEAFAQWLAFFQCHLRSDVRGAFEDQVGGALEDFCALVRHGLAPLVEAQSGHFEGVIQVLGGGEWHLTDFLAGCRVDHGSGSAVLGGEPLTTDEEIERIVKSVHGCRLHG